MLARFIEAELSAQIILRLICDDCKSSPTTKPKVPVLIIFPTGFDKPSPIQSQAWPYLLSGKDLIGIAQVCCSC